MSTIADEVLCHLEVSDDTAFERTDGLDITVVLAFHLLSAFSDSHNLVGSLVESHNGGLIDNHLFVIDDDGVGRTQVHC